MDRKKKLNRYSRLPQIFASVDETGSTDDKQLIQEEAAAVWIQRLKRLEETEDYESEVYQRRICFDIKLSPCLLLDGQGRARREAARRRKSECKVNLDILNSSRSSASKRLQKLYPSTTWRMDLRQQGRLSPPKTRTQTSPLFGLEGGPPPPPKKNHQDVDSLAPPRCFGLAHRIYIFCY